MSAARDRVLAMLLASASSAALWLGHPRIGFRDGDAVGYLTGAMSLAADRGYVDLSGNALNHWPPGYSWLLHWFSDPLAASQGLNYLSFGVAVGLIFALARTVGWSAWMAVCFSVVVGAGFLRGVATNATPDALTYAAFLFGALLYLRRDHRRWWAYAIWIALVPVKLITIVLVPAALIADRWLGRGAELRYFAAIGLFWGLAVGAVVAFNLVTIGQLIPESHADGSVGSVVAALGWLAKGAWRQWVASWYGSIRSLPVLLAFFAVMIAGAWAYASLRPTEAGRPLRLLGASVLGLSMLLLLIREYFGWRLMGYGVLLGVLGFQPGVGRERRWTTYAAASLLLAGLNVAVADAGGGNHPRYARLAASAIESGALTSLGIVETNSFHLLDVHVRVPTVPVRTLSEVQGESFLWVDLPSYDAIATAVWSIDRPSAGWCEVARLRGGVLFRRCQPNHE